MTTKLLIALEVNATGAVVDEVLKKFLLDLPPGLVTVYQPTVEEIGNLTGDRIVMSFHSEDADNEAEGVVTLCRGPYGPNVLVNGMLLGWVDLFPENDHPQFILDNRSEDDVQAKVVMRPGQFDLVVNRECPAARTSHPQGIHSDWDRVFTIFTDQPTEVREAS